MITKNFIISGLALGTLLMVGASAQAQELSIPTATPKHLKAVLVSALWPPGPYAYPPRLSSHSSKRAGVIVHDRGNG